MSARGEMCAYTNTSRERRIDHDFAAGARFISSDEVRGGIDERLVRLLEQVSFTAASLAALQSRAAAWNREQGGAMSTTLIKNGRIVTAVDDYHADILIDGGTIV